MFSISNKHEEFFDYLVANAQNFHRGAVIAHEVMQDVSTISLHLKEIVKLEHESSKNQSRYHLQVVPRFHHTNRPRRFL